MKNWIVRQRVVSGSSLWDVWDVQQAAWLDLRRTSKEETLFAASARASDLGLVLSGNPGEQHEVTLVVTPR